MSASKGATRKLKILMAHGYTSNQFQFHKRSGAIRKACRDVAEFHFINGPLVVQPITSAGDLDAPDVEEGKVIDGNTPIEEQPRAWWRADDDGNYMDWDKSVEYINGVLETQGPFDGIVGFSQGGCLAGILASAFENPDRMPGLKLPKGQGAFRFAVAVSGFRSRDGLHQKLFEQPVETPVLHVLGRADQIVDIERSRTLVDVCKNSRVELHDGGHSLPSQDFFATFATEPYAANDNWKTIPGPSERPRGETPAGSGTVTPTNFEPAHTTTTEATRASLGNDAATTIGERDIDPSNPLRSVPKKKANSPFLVHQRWKQEQELRRRKAEGGSDPSSVGGIGGGGSKGGTKKGKRNDAAGSDEEQTTDLTGALRVMVKLFRWGIMALAIVLASGVFVAGDPLWGYRGKYTKLRTYMPYREKIFSLPELAMFNGRDPKKPIYIAILGDVYDVSEGRRIYGPEILTSDRWL
uniref:Fsh1-domain-containing protein n=1 Tax=Melanopsichium pennsylvanicum 4 TaxID=1398559 RepID=A0A077QTB4_9BASI|nr:fsh1-domain-containing protein [Melanopsichium pennsylvanicum 4]